MIIKKSQVAVQLYTVRDYLKKPADIAASLKKIKRIGYGAVEHFGLGSTKTDDFKKMLDDNGLVACSSHVDGKDLFDDTNGVIDKLLEIGAKNAAYPFPAGVDFTSMVGVRSLARKLDKAGAALRKAGITLAYHNHNIEFVQIKGRTILELLYDLTSPENLQGEIDTYWVQAGGGDSVTWIKNLKGRLPILHLKDLGINSDREQLFEEIGYGNMEWVPIVKAAKTSGCKWYVVEQDRHHEKDDPFKSLKMSYEYIAENLCKD